MLNEAPPEAARFVTHPCHPSVHRGGGGPAGREGVPAGGEGGPARGGMGEKVPGGGGPGGGGQHGREGGRAEKDRTSEASPKAIPYELFPPKIVTWRDEAIPYGRTALLICRTA